MLEFQWQRLELPLPPSLPPSLPYRTRSFWSIVFCIQHTWKGSWGGSAGCEREWVESAGEGLKKQWVYRMVNAVIRKEAPISIAIHGRTPCQSAIQSGHSIQLPPASTGNRATREPTGQLPANGRLSVIESNVRAIFSTSLTGVRKWSRHSGTYTTSHICGSHSKGPISNPDDTIREMNYKHLTPNP